MSDDEQKQSMVAKIVGAGVALGAAWLVQKIIDSAWQKAKGHKPPQADSTAEDVKFSEVALAAGDQGLAHPGDGAQIAAMSGVVADVPAGARYGGTPARPMKYFLRDMAESLARAEGRDKKTGEKNND